MQLRFRIQNCDPMTCTIYIRKMRYEDARKKLETEVQAAFLRGETWLEIVHGIGEGKLRQLVVDFFSASDSLGEVETAPENTWVNPGSTMVRLYPPSRMNLRQYLH